MHCDVKTIRFEISTTFSINSTPHIIDICNFCEAFKILEVPAIDMKELHEAAISNRKLLQKSATDVESGSVSHGHGQAQSFHEKTPLLCAKNSDASLNGVVNLSSPSVSSTVTDSADRSKGMILFLYYIVYAVVSLHKIV